MAYSNKEFKETNINYLNKDFDTFKTNLIEYAKTYFPNTYKDFNETSPGMMLIEMSAYVGDVLSYYIDQQYKEMMLPLAQERRNISNIAKMLGYKPKPTIPAYVTLDVTQLLPATADVNNKKVNYTTALIIDEGLQIQSSLDSDIYFETIEPIDFSVSSSIDSTPTESVFDSDGIVTHYTVKRKVKAISGESKTTDFSVSSPQQYLRLTLTEKNVIDIVSVEDLNSGNKWYEVDYLAQDKIPQEDFYKNTNRTSAYHDISDQQLSVPVPYTLQYIKTGKRFITEVNDDNSTSLVFGNGVLRNGQIEGVDFINADKAGMVLPGTPAQEDLDINLDPRAGDSRMTLGETPANTTLRVTYRVGGGLRANVTAGTLATITNQSAKTLGGSGTIDISNADPAIGGSDQETIEEIRHKTKAFFATQNRCVTKEDYEARILNMPAKFGTIAKVFVDNSVLDSLGSATSDILSQLDLNASGGIDATDLNALKQSVVLFGEAGAIDDAPTAQAEMLKLETFFNAYADHINNIGTDLFATLDISVLGYDLNKNLVQLPPTANVTHPIKQNIKEYLSNYRLITDQLNIKDGNIINFGVAFEVTAHRSVNKQDVKLRCINKIIEYFDIDKMQFHQPIYTSDLEYELMGLDGVRSVNFIELCQDFNSLVLGDLRGYNGGGDVMYDWAMVDGAGASGQGTTGYGWFYRFSDFYQNVNESYVGKGVILPSVEPAVFELKNPKQNIRGVVL